MKEQRYTHGHDATVLKSHEVRTAQNSAAYLLDHLRPGMDLLDVGCGPGTITVDLARRVAPGRVVGTDLSADVLQAARRRAADAGVRVEFRRADLYGSDLGEAAYDVVHAHQVLQHVPDPVGALRQMRHCCRTGGVVAARDADYAAMFWYPLLRELERWRELYRTVARQNGGEPDAGRRMSAWARAAGFTDVAVTSSVWTYATAAERDWWGGMWAERITGSAITGQILDRGLATQAELQEISAAWRRWAADPDGYFAVTHGEIICVA